MARRRKTTKKWGKIGSPHSAKRRRFLASIRPNPRRRRRRSRRR